MVIARREKIIVSIAEDSRDEDILTYMPGQPPLLTLVIGARCKDGVIMMADTMEKSDQTETYGKYGLKIRKFGENIFLGCSGTIGARDVLFEKLNSESSNKQIDMKYLEEHDMIDILRPIVTQTNEHTMSNNLGLVDTLVIRRYPSNSKFEIWYLDAGGNVRNYPHFFPMGSAGLFADHLFKNIWEQDMAYDEVIELCWFCIRFLKDHFPKLGVGLDNDNTLPASKPQMIYIKDEEDKETVFDHEQIEKFDKNTELRIGEFFKKGYRRYLE